MTTPRFKTAESPFKSDNTASNQCGVTLMNNQIGAVVAQVMATKDNVSVRALPSMIRVDAIGRQGVRRGAGMWADRTHQERETPI